MKELGLSVLSHGADFVGLLRPWLDQFEAQNGVRIEANLFEWEAAWSEYLKISLYRHGPEISEMGSTWISSLVAMNVLKPFSERELKMFGGASAFLPSTWQFEPADAFGSVWALPWLAYERLIYYRRDVLDKAGIDETSAFQTHEQFARTLERLVECKVDVPWCIPTRHSRDTIHNIASWVWSAGGDFVSPDGRHILFNEPAARAGMRAYFDLYRYLAPSARHKYESDSLFKQGQAAVVMSGPWLWPLDLQQSDTTSQVAGNIGVAIPLSVAFIGFSYLVVWKYTGNEMLVTKLLRQLAGPELLAAISLRAGGPLSVRLDALEHSPLAGEPNYQMMVKALKTGRSFPAVSLWGLVEEKLDTALEMIWNEVLSEEHPDIDAIMNRNLDPLARRLELTLSSDK
jgi:multiple sugar transport system substrate-binding protein